MSIFLKQAFRSFAPTFLLAVLIFVFANKVLHDDLPLKWLLVLLFPVYCNQYLSTARLPVQLLLNPIPLKRLLLLTNTAIASLTALTVVILLYILEEVYIGTLLMHFVLLLTAGNVLSSTPLSYRFRVFGIPVFHFFLATLMITAVDGYLIVMGQVSFAIPIVAVLIAAGWILSVI